MCECYCYRLFIYLFVYFCFVLLYNTVLVLPYINMNLPWVYMCSQSWTPSHLPSHTISLGHPSAPAPSILDPALNLDWRFISYTILYMFQCHSPKSSHPLPLPLSPKDCSIHLCLFCCLTKLIFKWRIIALQYIVLAWILPPNNVNQPEVYIFQCHSLKSSHPLPLPQSPKVHSIHLCLFCWLTYRVIITIFLNFIYMC